MLTGGMGAIFWLIVAVVLFVIEGATVQLICIWFAIGAVVTVPVSALGAPVWAQLLVFLVASVAVLIVGRPILTKRLHKDKVPTNAEIVIGQIGVVKEDIDNIQQTGRVQANGLTWTARALRDDMVVPAGSQVRVLRIDGVKLIVEPLEVERQV